MMVFILIVIILAGIAYDFIFGYTTYLITYSQIIDGNREIKSVTFRYRTIYGIPSMQECYEYLQPNKVNIIDVHRL